MPKRGHRRQSRLIRDVGARVRALRKQKGLSQAELAKLAGSSASHLNRLEQGKDVAPTLVTLESLAGALRVPVADLFPAQEKARKPRPATAGERAWSRLEASLRGRSPKFLRFVNDLVRAFDRSMA